MIKPGYRTSEFWFTMVSFIFSGLFLAGIITDNADKEDLIRDVSHGVESCILIGGQLFILYKYIKGRSNIKQSWWNSQSVPISKEVDTNESNKQRTNKNRSRKTNSNNKSKSTRSKKNSSR